MKIVSVIGARPQFIKAAVISKVVEKLENVKNILIHTGQHYDENMSKIFFDELEIPRPNFNLEVGSATHAVQTAQIMMRLENVLIKEKPDWLLVYGDTNSTIAAALTAAKLHIRIAHVEAGLRSFNRIMPEEINRITTDKISDLLFAPTENAMKLLAKEGLANNAVNTGDVMYDSVLFYEKLAEKKYSLEQITNLDEFYLATIHRAENTDNERNLQNIFSAFSELNFPVIIPVHPRTRLKLNKIKYSNNVKIIEPVSYLEMILLLKNAKKVLTDSGGLQKEAYFLGKPCLTLRTETEWVETLKNNWNIITGANIENILEKISLDPTGPRGNYFGEGNAGEKILNELLTRNN